MSYFNMWSSHFCVLLLVITLVPVTGYPVELKYLYDVHMPVESRDQNALKDTFKEAFVTVLVRVTGNSNIVAKPEINDLLKNPSRFVQQYRYYEKSDELPPTLNLWIHFDGESMERQLIKAGLPVWGKERPAVLIWFAVERQGKRFLVGEDTAFANS